MNFARSILDQFGGVRADPRAEKLSREKLSTLRQRADNAMAANRQLGADRDELREALSRVELSLSILEGDGRSESNRASTNKVSIERCRTDIAKLKRELAQIEARRGKAVELSSATNLLVSNLETWLSALKGPAIAFLGSAEPKVLANESTADAIERRRRRIRELVADRGQVDAAPILSIEAKRAALRQIEELAERGRPNVFDTLQVTDGNVAWPQHTHQLRVMNGTGHETAASTHPDALAVLAWIQKDAMVAAINREIDECADDAHALNAADRASKRKEILDDKLAVEREEELLISQLEASGAQVARRPDADPRAVLGLASSLPGTD